MASSTLGMQQRVLFSFSAQLQMFSSSRIRCMKNAFVGGGRFIRPSSVF
jgi:hypothetical protein